MTGDGRGAEGTPSQEEKAYFRSVEERFCALRGAAMLLSPRDWALMASWWSERVPLPIVLESLDDVFAARARRGEAAAEIATLAYVRNEVQRRFRLHRELSALRRGEGEQSEVLRREIRLHLGRISKSLTTAGERARQEAQEPLAQALIIAASDTKALRRALAGKDWNPSTLYESLAKIESDIMDSLRASLSDAEREALRRKAREMLGDRAHHMTPEARKVTLASIEEDLQRRSRGIPGIASFIEG